MVCCTIIAALLGLIFAPLLVLRKNPMQWRLANGTTSKSETPMRAQTRLKSFSYAFAGLRFAIQNEPNMRIHMGAMAAITLLGLWLKFDPSEWRWIGLAIALVLMAEAINTAVEQACNAVTTNYHPAIKASKDVAAGAVTIAALNALVIGGSIFLPHLQKNIPAPPKRPFICGFMHV
jgi:diacylglycerol kinase